MGRSCPLTVVMTAPVSLHQMPYARQNMPGACLVSIGKLMGYAILCGWGGQLWSDSHCRGRVQHALTTYSACFMGIWVMTSGTVLLLLTVKWSSGWLG